MRIKFMAIAFGLIVGNTALAAPYPLGTMTCDDIGAFASEAMRWRKEQKIPYEEAAQRLEVREYGDPVEKKPVDHSRLCLWKLWQQLVG